MILGSLSTCCRAWTEATPRVQTADHGPEPQARLAQHGANNLTRTLLSAECKKYQPASPQGPGAHTHSPLCRAWHQPASPQGRGAPGTHTAAPRPALCLEPVTHLPIAILPASLPQRYMWINCSVYVHIFPFPIIPHAPSAKVNLKRKGFYAGRAWQEPRGRAPSA